MDASNAKGRSQRRKSRIPHIVSVWSQQNRLALGQLKVSEKSNEITAVPELLPVLELKGCIVTLDAMGCQKKIPKQIVQAGADYVLPLKGNHELWARRPVDLRARPTASLCARRPRAIHLVSLPRMPHPVTGKTHPPNDALERESSRISRLQRSHGRIRRVCPGDRPALYCPGNHVKLY
jgi:hypothetical protein